MLPVFLLVSSLVSVEGRNKDSCLGYDVLCTTADYQFRRYKESVWVGILASHLRVNIRDTVQLYRYLIGENLQGMEIQHPGQYLASLSRQRVLAIYVILPQELWDNPPTPNNPQVFITRFPMMDLFARGIRGFVMTDASDFNRMLTAQNAHVNNSNFFVSYCTGSLLTDSTSFLRLILHGEILFVATGGFDCPVP